MQLKSFTPSELQRNSSEVFNEVQSNGKAVIESKSRPAMTLILTSELLCLQSKSNQFHAAIKVQSKEIDAPKLKLSEATKG